MMSVSKASTQPNDAAGSNGHRKGSVSQVVQEKKAPSFEVTFEYNGDLFPDEVNPRQPIEAAWHRALAYFGIRPGDAQNLGLFREGNEVDRNQSFEQAGIAENTVLRISPRVQRAG